MGPFDVALDLTVEVDGVVVVVHQAVDREVFKEVVVHLEDARGVWTGIQLHLLELRNQLGVVGEGIFLLGREPLLAECHSAADFSHRLLHLIELGLDSLGAEVRLVEHASTDGRGSKSEADCSGNHDPNNRDDLRCHAAFLLHAHRRTSVVFGLPKVEVFALGRTHGCKRIVERRSCGRDRRWRSCGRSHWAGERCHRIRHCAGR